MEAGEEKGGWESGFFFLIFTDIVKMGWAPKPTRCTGKCLVFNGEWGWGLFYYAIYLL